MSLIGSLLGLVLIPLKAKPPKEADNLAVMALADELRRTQFALDHWRNAGNALMAENERLRLELQDARAQLDPYYRGPQQAQFEATLARYQQQAAQQMRSYQNLGFQQALAYGDCTCVPARANALGVHPAEPLPR